MTAHPDPELLTAFVDGELDADDLAEVAAHVQVCAPCAAVVADERTTVSILRSLAAAEPPAGFLDRVAQRGPAPRSQVRHHTRFAVANIAAAAAVWIGVVGVVRLTTGGEPVRPALAELVDAHTANSFSGLDRISVRSTDAVPSSLDGGYRLIDTRVVDGRRQAVYTDGREWLSMFVEPGRLDTNALPADAHALEGGPGWAMRIGTDEVVVVQRGDTVVVLVGAGSETVMTAAGGRAPSPSVHQRIDAAARGVLDSFGFG